MLFRVILPSAIISSLSPIASFHPNSFWVIWLSFFSSAFSPITCFSVCTPYPGVAHYHPVCLSFLILEVHTLFSFLSLFHYFSVFFSLTPHLLRHYFSSSHGSLSSSYQRIVFSHLTIYCLCSPSPSPVSFSLFSLISLFILLAVLFPLSLFFSNVYSFSSCSIRYAHLSIWSPILIPFSTIFHSHISLIFPNFSLSPSLVILSFFCFPICCPPSSSLLATFLSLLLKYPFLSFTHHFTTLFVFPCLISFHFSFFLHFFSISPFTFCTLLSAHQFLSLKTKDERAKYCLEVIQCSSRLCVFLNRYCKEAGINTILRCVCVCMVEVILFL